MFTILPLTVWIRVAHPTEQNGQMLGVVLASLIRSSCARAAAGASDTPSPTRPPMAVPAPALAVSRKKSRRVTCIWSSALKRGAWMREALSDGRRAPTRRCGDDIRRVSRDATPQLAPIRRDGLDAERRG